MRALEQDHPSKRIEEIETRIANSSRSHFQVDIQSTISAQIIFTFLRGYFRVVKVLKTSEDMGKQIEALLTKLGI